MPSWQRSHIPFQLALLSRCSLVWTWTNRSLHPWTVSTPKCLISRKSLLGTFLCSGGVAIDFAEIGTWELGGEQATLCDKPWLISIPPPKTNNGISTIWRCVFHWTWWRSIAMLVFRSVIPTKLNSGRRFFLIYIAHFRRQGRIGSVGVANILQGFEGLFSDDCERKGGRMCCICISWNLLRCLQRIHRCPLQMGIETTKYKATSHHKSEVLMVLVAAQKTQIHKSFCLLTLYWNLQRLGVFCFVLPSALECHPKQAAILFMAYLIIVLGKSERSSFILGATTARLSWRVMAWAWLATARIAELKL